MTIYATNEEVCTIRNDTKMVCWLVVTHHHIIIPNYIII
jgi:hypothetical protein